MNSDIHPIVHFYRLLDDTRPPQRADRSAAGTLPTRAYRYCQALTAATGFGWWLFPPADIQLLWRGGDIFWQLTGWGEWLLLAPAAQFPHFSNTFDYHAPEFLKGCAPPFLSALPEPATVQIWTGLMARTAPEWSLLIRAPANLPTSGSFSMYEGIIETDRWFGPLFTNIRFNRSDVPIRLRPDFPLAQVQPLPRIAYANATLRTAGVTTDMADLTSQDWTDYQTAVASPNEDPCRAFGNYAVASRKRAQGITSRGSCAISKEEA